MFERFSCNKMLGIIGNYIKFGKFNIYRFYVMEI